MTKVIKSCVMLTLLWTSAFLISWCTWFWWDKETEVDTSSTWTWVESNDVPEVASLMWTFDSVVAEWKEKVTNSIATYLDQWKSLLEQWKINSSSTWKITLAYWDTVWNTDFNFSGQFDKELDQFLWSFNLWVWLTNWTKAYPMLPDNLNAWIGIQWFLNKDNYYFQLSWLSLDWVEKYFVQSKEDNIEYQKMMKIVDKIKWKWISFDEKTLCNKNAKTYSEEWCEAAKTIATTKKQMFDVIDQTQESVSESVKLQNELKEVVLEWIANILNSDVLIDSEKTEYEWKEAYKFNIDEEWFKYQLWKSLKQFYWIVLDQSKVSMQNMYASMWEEMPEEYYTEMKKEMENWIDEWLAMIWIKNFEWYIVYNEEWNDIEIKNITFYAKEDPSINTLAPVEVDEDVDTEEDVENEENDLEAILEENKDVESEKSIQLEANWIEDEENEEMVNEENKEIVNEEDNEIVNEEDEELVEENELLEAQEDSYSVSSEPVEINMSYSTSKKEIKLEAMQWKEMMFRTLFTYEFTDEWTKFNIWISPNLWMWLVNNWIEISSTIWTTQTATKLEQKSYSVLTFKKELLEAYWVQNNIVLTIDMNTSTQLNWELQLPDISKATPFYKVESYINNLEKQAEAQKMKANNTNNKKPTTNNTNNKNNKMKAN